MDIEKVKKVLEGIGLDEEEALIYLASLELGPQPASIIARKAGLKRGQTYNKLALLIKRGIIQEYTEKKIRMFSCLPPENLISILEHNQQQIENQKKKLTEIVPLLMKMQTPLVNQPKIKYFQGIEGIKEIYEDTIREQQPIYAFGDFDYIFKDEELNDWIWNNYAKTRSEKGVNYLGIINKSKLSDKAHKARDIHKRKMKMLENIDLPVEINIYGDKVSITSAYYDIAGLIIEDGHIADTFRNLHKAMWELLPNYK
ncbi:hypothetical protein KJ632_04475 [Patescibacteria group bacterium]|nr:hypothetical protein [Patescibacteria group bacterium]